MTSAHDFFAATRDAQRVLVIDPGMLGDAVHLVPALWELRRHYSKAELHVVCSPVGAELHKMAGCADKLWPLPQARERRRVSEQLRVLLALRRLRFDVSINFSDNDRNVIYAGVVGARHRLGRSLGRRHFWSRWCIPTWVTARHPDEPSFEQRRLMLAECGFALEPPRFNLRVPEEARAWAKSQMPEGALHFSLNAAAPLREWPLAHWIDLARRLCQPQGPFHIVATSSSDPRECARLEAFTVGCARLEAQFFSGLPIARLAGLMNQCALHIGSDTGALHLAVALGLPTISFFRNFPGHRRWVPRGPQHRSFTVECPCIGQRNPPCLANEAPRCLTGITPETVAAAALEQLAARTE